MVALRDHCEAKGKRCCRSRPEFDAFYLMHHKRATDI